MKNKKIAGAIMIGLPVAGIVTGLIVGKGARGFAATGLGILGLIVGFGIVGMTARSK